MPRGGKQPGSGRKKGFKFHHTIEKEEARKRLREMVISKLEPLVEAQLANARGIKYLVVRDKRGGKFIRVTEAMAKSKQGGEEIIEVWEKDPSIQAFTDLLNRALDKPAEQEQQVAVAGSLEIRWKGDDD